MDTRLILLPGLAMVLLTFAVAAAMYRRRVAQMRRERIGPQAVATSAQVAARLTDSAAADNFRNLFELPVLFYFGLATAALTGQATPLLLVLAWLFVALRVVHSAIQCGYNRVMHRFLAFISSTAVLAAMWLLLGWRLLAA